MAADLASALMRQLPGLSVFPESKQLPATAKYLARQIVECIHFVRPRSFQPETGCAKLARKFPQISDSKLDFDFPMHECSVLRGQLSVHGPYLTVVCYQKSSGRNALLHLQEPTMHLFFECYDFVA